MFDRCRMPRRRADRAATWKSPPRTPTTTIAPRVPKATEEVVAQERHGQFPESTRKIVPPFVCKLNGPTQRREPRPPRMQSEFVNRSLARDPGQRLPFRGPHRGSWPIAAVQRPDGDEQARQRDERCSHRVRPMQAGVETGPDPRLQPPESTHSLFG